MATVEEILELARGLSGPSLEELKTFVEFLKSKQAAAGGTRWSYDFVERLSEATCSASRDPAGMEIKAAQATCGGVTRPALWEHPPVVGSAIASYLVPIPTGLHDLKLKFSIGIRDGSELPPDRSVAFRVLVHGWKLWSAVKSSHAWEEHELGMPQLGSDLARIDFMTDGLGHHQWDWAVWGTPSLEGDRGS